MKIIGEDGQEIDITLRKRDNFIDIVGHGDNCRYYIANISYKGITLLEGIGEDLGVKLNKKGQIKRVTYAD